ncbi:NAD(P)/FAD-dependent oxidoreductase [Rhodococcus sp. IEGM 1381]|uniref:flavin-containing monooxygenase n=1 Tax=Rhodococcus sp. IEGM 1381 TaxID=3047085 RepID=UPI0024B863FC|nr:NAD(P)/FAD-dependent oxidoreductase [Rhodococcus sp. IEGM 1381]MDI9897439.1 NAD(P)/FAD-dependent oxidoreductase [Rhodococcus sp. IEGM 1381]
MTSNASDRPTDYDAIVVGTGFAGIYATHKLRDQLGLNVLTVDTAGDIGGTWYWNRYPGSRCDIESIHYSYSFSDEVQQEWTWTEKFASQPEILEYLNYVVDKFDLRRNMLFDTTIESMEWIDGRWTVRTDTGTVFTADYVICGTGNLSVPKAVDIEGIDSFAGEVYLTGRWPHSGVDFAGKRVGVIGTGSTGIQVIQEVSKIADHLTVFQRTANYATPIGNGPSDEQRVKAVKEEYARIREASRNSFVGIPYDKAQPSALAVSEAERRRTFDECWDAGGFSIASDSFQDVMFDKAANDTVSEYIRDRIRARVEDPELAELLAPDGHAYGTKRPPLEIDYYETFNRDNVDLVDVRTHPIESVTPTGVRTDLGNVDLDVLVLATGFDAMTGPLLKLGIRGKEGKSLNDAWSNGPRTYLGVMVHDFPNLFLITGPQSPSVLYNMPLAIEDHVDFAADAIAHMRDARASVMEAELTAQDEWVDHSNAVAETTLMPTADSWYVGSNVPGKPRAVMLYLGGAAGYRAICDDVVSSGYRGFAFLPPVRNEAENAEATAT